MNADHPRHARLRTAARKIAPTLAAGTTAALVAVALTGPAPRENAPPPGAPSVVSDVVSTVDVENASYLTAVAAAEKTTPKVTLIGTGGTIAGVAAGRETPTDYRGGTIPVEDLLAQIQPEVGDVADVTPFQAANGGSGSFTIEDYRNLSLAVDRALETADAVVVTSGTDTMEEIAYWLDLTVQSRKPVVITGAMRPWAAETVDGPLVFGADGPANLYNAIALAASQRTYCFGTVLMLNDEINAARDVTKTSTTRTDTFQTRELGVLGYVDGPDITLGRAPARVRDCTDPARWATPFDVSEIPAEDLPRTEVVYSYQGAGGEAISAFADAGVKGIVTAGTGAGNPSPAQVAARDAAVEDGVLFVNGSRTGSGSVTSGGDGVVPAQDLLPQKARLLLLLSLAEAKGDTDRAAELFTDVGNPTWKVDPATVTG